MITNDDLNRLPIMPNLTKTQIKRITNAENACRNTENNWAKSYWYDVLYKLCKMYGALDYFRKVSH